MAIYLKDRKILFNLCSCIGKREDASSVLSNNTLFNSVLYRVPSYMSTANSNYSLTSSFLYGYC